MPKSYHGLSGQTRLNSTEKRRFLRGLCRLTIFCNIFGAIEETIDGPELNSDEENSWFDEDEDEDFDPLEYGIIDPAYSLDRECLPLYLFWNLITPWECEEIGCVLEYFWEKYQDISEICADSLRLRSQCPEGTPPWFQSLPPGENGLPPRYGSIEDMWDIEHNSFKRCFILLISIGPDFLYRLLNAKYRDQRDMVFVNSKEPYFRHFRDYFIDFPVCEWQWRKTQAKWKGHNIPITEKDWSTLPLHKKPNIAWQWQWMDSRTGLIWPVKRKRLSRKDQICREWGCSIWDEERLEGWNTDWRKHIPKDK